ncbi:cobaltochelatase subunit CobN [uncultured Propionivibrio sp.]|uniref:cobaltochelatase subunit CobN n=1 Tax=uncultured Propionivibrio sp. TaxID=426737 RepID=UPI0029C06B70|nr:cobaltochelatase subunit CobN [uncultured Propionivibrio sp.]
MSPNDRRRETAWRDSLIAVFCRVLLGFLGCALSGFACAKPLSMAIIPGDPSTPAALEAIKQLRQEAALKEVKFHILPFTQLQDRDLKTLAGADVALIYNMGREIAEAVTPAIRKMSARGAKAYAIGSSFEEVERKAGFVQDDALRAYAQAGGIDNLSSMIKRVLSRDFGLPVQYGEVVAFPMSGLWNPVNGKTFSNFEDYAADYVKRRPEVGDHPWVGILFHRPVAQSGRSELLMSMFAALEARGFNVVAAFGYPSEIPAQKYFIDRNGKSRVAALVGLAAKLGNTPERSIPVMKQLDVPMVNAISLQSLSQKEWEDSPIGLSHTERSWQVALPEFAGAVAPTVVAAKERRRDRDSGLEYIAEVPIAERIERLADRIKKFTALRYELNPNKRVAIIYYNYPAGKENVGAAYLNVMPRSLWQILTRLERDGYSTQGRPASEDAMLELLRNHGTNVGNWSRGALEKLVRSGNAMLLPISEYRRWLEGQPVKLRTAMIKAWGEPEKSKVMVWKDPKGTPYFVFPAQRFGNLVFAPQPTRGWEGDPDKMFHDVVLPPHHQYLAFYLWLQKGFKAHALVHVGTHGTHEWLSGKEIGYTPADPGEALMGDVPQFYPYVVDDIGEGLQAKRRGLAATISYMTPPFDKASLNQELKLLKALIGDYEVAAQKSKSTAAAKLVEIDQQARKTGVLKDIGIKAVKDEEDVEKLDEYFEEVSNSQAPYGLHTFGVAPEKALRLTTAEAMLSMAGELPPDVLERRKEELSVLMERSAAEELNALTAGLGGRYIAAGPGGDPIRNPDSLPTGRNLYGFDPTRLPSPGIWLQGKKLAEQFVSDYRKRHGQYPDRLAFTLWSTETMNHEGVTEAEILALMGVRPVWNERGRVSGLEVIPRKELGRPRVDITMTPSGLYRDTLPNIMLLLDDAVSKVKDLEEDDNPIRENVRATQKALEEKGVNVTDAARMAAVRIFTEPPGAYGTGVSRVVDASNTWKNEGEIADVYFNRLGHLFGQGYWGDRPGGKDLAVNIFKMALKGAKATVIARSSNLFATLDNDDLYDYMGGSAMAIRQVNGQTPETHVLNLANPAAGKHETLDKYMGREMRTRYTNPEWVKSMLQEGYGGARYIKTVADNLWGWQVTVPEAVDGAKWQELYETYVTDRNNLGIKEKFREARNLLAYQALVDKMLVAINKGYWKADPEVKAHLDKVNREVIAEAGVACDANTCSSPEITALAEAQDRRAMSDAESTPAPNLGRQSALSATNSAMVSGATDTATTPASQEAPPANEPAANTKGKSVSKVEGFEVEEQTRRLGNMTPEVRNWALTGFAVLVLSGVGFNARRRKLRLSAAN